MMRKAGMTATFLLMIYGALAVPLSFAQQPTLPLPTLPPPGSLVTPPAAPGAPGTSQPSPQAPAAPAPAAPSDQSRPAEVGGPTEMMLEARPVLMLKGQSNWDDGFDNLMEAFRKLKAEASKEKLTVVGRPQAAFTSTDDFGFKYEAMVQLSALPSPAPPALGKEFELGQSPAGKALKFTHAGAYDDIDTTYEAITAYLDEKGLKARNLFVEEYVTDPKSAEDAELLLNILVLVE